MKLHVREWDEAGVSRSALLVHGLDSDSETWWRLGPALVERGYRVLAPDLRGHGLSPKGSYSIEDWAGDLVESSPPGPDLAVGHSLGGAVLAAALERLRPGRAVFVDPAWHVPGGWHDIAASAEMVQLVQTREEIGTANPGWTEGDLDRKMAALSRWDPDTCRAFLDGRDVDVRPSPAAVPSLVIRADPSLLVPDEDADRLRREGFAVRSIRGGGHSMYRDDFEAFMACLDGWLESPPR